jgi:hypothetical protein
MVGDVFVLVRGSSEARGRCWRLAIEEDVMPEIEGDLRLPSVA